MFLLYLDDSGSSRNRSDNDLILAGLALFERRAHWLSEYIDTKARELWPDSPFELEFRGNDIRAGKKQWRGIGRDDRLNAYKDILRHLGSNREIVLFGAVIHIATASPNDAMEVAFEQVASRFDHFLRRLHLRGNTQRGLLILDESVHETSLQSLARDYRRDGHKWGKLHNIVDVPLFVDSKATRLIQCADMVAYALRRYYENGESDYFDLIANSFDSEGQALHGLHHFTPPGSGCNCYACRR